MICHFDRFRQRVLVDRRQHDAYSVIGNQRRLHISSSEKQQTE
jgi:hypothetical protein